MNRLKHISKTISILSLVFMQCGILPDFEPPNVTIHSPKAGETAYGSVEIFAEASDNKRLDRMELYLDAELVKTVRENSIRFTWDLTLTNSDAEHSVRVKAIDRSDNWDNAEVRFLGYGKLPEKPVLQRPLSGASISFMDLNLNWTDVQGTKYYHLQIDNNENFESPFINDESVISSQYAIGIPLESGVYYWRVRACSNWEDWGVWSDSSNFRVTMYSYDDELSWYYQTGGAVETPAIGEDGVIYAGSDDGNVYALYPDGSLKWKYEGGEAFGSPAIENNETIYVTATDGYLYSIDVDGRLQWKFKGGFYRKSIPSIGFDGTIFIGSSGAAGNSNDFFALNPDGTVRWKLKQGIMGMKTAPAVGGNGTIYVNGYLFFAAIDSAGTIINNQYDLANNFSSPAIGIDGSVYVGSQGGKFFALNPDGTLRWSIETGNLENFSSPAIGPDCTIYVGSVVSDQWGSKGRIYALNSDGSSKWFVEVGSAYFSAPAIGSDGSIYVSCANGKLYVFSQDGKLVKSGMMQRVQDSSLSAPKIGSNGIVYIGSSDGCIYALRSNSDGPAKSPWPEFRQNNQNTGRAAN